jgi:transcriptional regulator with XRE-family HTH domain
MKQSEFIKFVKKQRTERKWSLAEMARWAQLTQPEVSRVESGARLPTLRHVKGLAEAFHATQHEDSSWGYPDWVARLVDLGERARIDARSGPGRWAKRVTEEPTECHST